MNAAPGGELRAAGGLWGPPARALREMLGRRFPEEHRPTWLSPGADQENSVLIGLLVAGWLTFRVAAPRLSPATTWGPSPANLVVANRPRGLTRDTRLSLDRTDCRRSCCSTILGCFGAVFQRWLARAKPRFEITSIGFTGMQGLIRIDDNLISRTNRDNWGPMLRRFEPYDELIERERTAAETAERLTKAVSIAEDWLEQYPARGIKEIPTCLELDEVKKHPYMRETIIGAVLMGLCRRNETGTAPHSLESVLNCSRLAYLTKRDKKEEWYLFLDRFGITFSFRDLITQQAPQPAQPGSRVVHRYHPSHGPQCHSVPERALCARVSAALRNGGPV